MNRQYISSGIWILDTLFYLLNLWGIVPLCGNGEPLIEIKEKPPTPDRVSSPDRGFVPCKVLSSHAPSIQSEDYPVAFIFEFWLALVLSSLSNEKLEDELFTCRKFPQYLHTSNELITNWWLWFLPVKFPPHHRHDVQWSTWPCVGRSYKTPEGYWTALYCPIFVQLSPKIYEVKLSMEYGGGIIKLGIEFSICERTFLSQKFRNNAFGLEMDRSDGRKCFEFLRDRMSRSWKNSIVKMLFKFYL